MAGADTLLNLPYKANEALVNNRFVKLAGDQLVDQADTAGERCIGVGLTDVSTAEAAAGKAVAVMVEGVAYVEASAAISRGALVMASANGRGATATTGLVVQGMALKAAGAAGDLIPVLLAAVGHLAP